eukprot:scaffold25800_cov162-Cylindrotheca_fusiformis.AAC.2
MTVERVPSKRQDNPHAPSLSVCGDFWSRSSLRYKKGIGSIGKAVLCRMNARRLEKGTGVVGSESAM